MAIHELAPSPEVEVPAGVGRASSRRGVLPPVVGFLVRRLGAGILTVLVVSVLAFTCTSLLPGDAAQVVLGSHATPEALAHLNRELGADKSVEHRYVGWLSGMLLHGDFGKSAVAIAEGNQSPAIAPTLKHPLINSLVLAAITTLFMVPLTLLLGALAGLRVGRFVDHAISIPALVLGGLPEFVSGTILIYLFFTVLALLPPVSLVSPGASPLSSPTILVLPVLTLLVVTLGSGIRQARAGMIQVMTADFVQFARLNGVREWRVITHYALRNAAATSVQTIAQNIQYLAGGVIIVEALFSYPGIGAYLVNAVQARDTSEVLAAAIVLAVFYTIVNIAADLLVVFLVPKLRTQLA